MKGRPTGILGINNLQSPANGGGPVRVPERGAHQLQLHRDTDRQPLHRNPQGKLRTKLSETHRVGTLAKVKERIEA